jgi:ABC-type lipoprotein export system ATPase subunit
MALLEARQVCKYFREGSAAEVRALQDVSVSIAPGSLAVLTGPSGSGKTTLLALLGALERPSRGQVLFAGRDLSGCSDVELARIRRRMGFIFQNFALIPNLPVWENITYPLIPRGVSRAQRYKRARALLAHFGMPDKLVRRPKELSGGEQQRVAVARALAGQPEVLLADEPTSNLDRAASQVLVSVLQEMHQEGKTLLVSTHDPQVIALATRVYELEGGRLKSVKVLQPERDRP